MPKGYRPYLPDQDLLLPPSLREWVAEEPLVYFVSDVVDQLDLSAVHAVYGEEKRGQPPYNPRLMIKLLVYGYCTGVFSSRRIQKRLQEDIPFRVLAAGNDPDFRTISGFRKIHIAKSVHSGIGHFRIRVPILKQFKGVLKVPVEGLRTILMEQER